MMAWRFRKRVKIIPGVYINISRSGVSATVGPRGLNLNVGKNGTFLNTGIPGTGIYSRQKIGGSENKNFRTDMQQQYQYPNGQTVGQEIKSGDAGTLTSVKMASVKQFLELAIKQRGELLQSVKEIERDKILSIIKLYVSYIFLYGFFNGYAESVKKDIEKQQRYKIKLIKLIDTCNVDLSVNFDESLNDLYGKLKKSFDILKSVARIWDITAQENIDKVRERSFASRSFTRKIIKFTNSVLEPISNRYTAMMLENANGGDLYIYPSFIIYFESYKKFSIIALNELELSCSYVQFSEDEKVPDDSEIVGYTWQKANKDGSRDKRFKENKQIPIALYGEMNITSASGINERYMISNSEALEKFAHAFQAYQNAIGDIS